MVSKKDHILGCLQLTLLLIAVIALGALNEYLDFYRFSCYSEQMQIKEVHRGNDQR